MELENCTIADNSTSSGSTVSAVGEGLEFTNTIIDGDCSGTVFFTGGGNIESPGDSCGLDSLTDHVSVDPSAVGIEPLTTGFRLMPVHLLTRGGIAVDGALNDPCPADDQRGDPRPVDGDLDGDAQCDVGAIELQHLFDDDFESATTDAWSSSVP